MSLEQPLPTLPNMPSTEPSDSSSQLDSSIVSLMSITTVTEYCETLVSEPANAEDEVAALAGEASPNAPPPEAEPEGDQQLIEALRNPKDRLFVLKLGENIEKLIQERHLRSEYKTTLSSSYHRLLVHRAAAYYKVQPESIDAESGSKTITLTVMAESRIPSRRMGNLVPADDAPQPTFKIMRRTTTQRSGSKPSSQSGSGNDESALGTGDVSDGGPSEGGSSSRGSKKKTLTMSERQAQYEEARSRIFKDLEEKDKKADMSASSSTLSLMSAGSSSGGGGGGGPSSIGESLDDTGSVDREWSNANKEKRDGSHRASSVASSSRSFRSAGQPWNNQGNSPGFVPRTLYDPSAPSTPSSNSSTSSSYMPYQPAVYPMYSYPGGPYLPPYPHFAYYPYPPPPPQPMSDPNTPNNDNSSSPVEGYNVAAAYPPYVWSGPPPAPMQPSEYPQQHPYPPHMHAYTYPGPVPQFIPPVHHPPPHASPGQHQTQPQHPQSPPMAFMPNRPHSLDPNQEGWRQNFGQGQMNGMNPLAPMFHMGPNANNQRPSGQQPRNGEHHQKRNQMRSGFSASASTPEIGGQRIGHSRRTPSNGGNNGIETASTASSSTSSSSSAQTFTSSTSSAHPSLPPRPDWAVGLKPDPTLHHSNSSRHHQQRPHPVPLQSNDLAHQRGQVPMNGPQHRHNVPMQQQQRVPHSVPTQPNGSQPRSPPTPNDFPPLSVAPNGDRRPMLGAWAAPPASRTLLGPSQSARPHSNGTNAAVAPFHGNGVNGHQLSSDGDAPEEQNSRLDEPDSAFERPGPKAGVALFNPNAGTKSLPPRNGKGIVVSMDKEKEEKPASNTRVEAIANAILVDRMGALRIVQDGEQSTST